MAHVVVRGGGLGGLPTAYELRHFLPREHQITLISDRSQFTFIPGLIRVALNLKPLSEIQLDLKSLVEPKGIQYIKGKVTTLDPDRRLITIDREQQLNYDYLAIATGASLAFDEISGLGVHGGYTQSICTPDHALEARLPWLDLLDNPGALVVGAMPGAGCFGPAYEFVLMADWELRRRGIRDKVDITYVTPEPYIGHLGVGGVTNAQKLTDALMAERGIKAIANAQITHIDAQTITLADGRQLPFKYSMILPSFRGVSFVKEVPGLSNERGFIPVLSTCLHPDFPRIYALGVTVALPQLDRTTIPIGLPKSGQMTEAMGAAVAHNIAVELGAIKSSFKIPTLEALCFAEFGKTGIAYIAAPVIPEPATDKRRYSYAVRGRWVNWVKEAFEIYFMYKMRWGLGMSWFEKLGLRLMFGLSMLQSLKPDEENNLLKTKTQKSQQVLKS